MVTDGQQVNNRRECSPLERLIVPKVVKKFSAFYGTHSQIN
jgi:hypothetical protein